MYTYIEISTDIYTNIYIYIYICIYIYIYIYIRIYIYICVHTQAMWDLESRMKEDLAKVVEEKDDLNYKYLAMQENFIKANQKRGDFEVILSYHMTPSYVARLLHFTHHVLLHFTHEVMYMVDTSCVT